MMWMPLLVGACCGSALTTTYFYIVLGRDLRREELLRWESPPVEAEDTNG